MDNTNEPLPRNKLIRPQSTYLRNNPTPQEKRLWYEFLTEYPVQFNRQRIIGNFIADFYCHRAKLVIELDGCQHRTETGKENDANRDTYMESCGLMVLRFTNTQIDREFKSVCELIDRTVEQRISEKS